MLDASLIAVYSGFILQTAASVPDISADMPKHQGRGVHHVPCSSGWSGTQVGYNYYKIPSCRKQAAEVGGDGILLRLLTAQEWGLSKQCMQT